MNRQGGSIANEQGDILEDLVNSVLLKKGYEFVDKKKFNLALYLEQKIYTRQLIIGETIYGTKWKTDFTLHRPDKKPINLIIECKWQQTSGSVDILTLYTI